MRTPTAVPGNDTSTLRAFAVLECVVRASAPVSLDEATQACGLPKPTVYRILGMLTRGDLIEREPVSKRYSVGRRLSTLAVDVMQGSTARAARHSILRQLVDEIGETCNFNMLEGDEVVWLDRVETSSPLRLHMEPGTRVPLHCTASGKLFASQLSEKQLANLLGKGPLRRYTERTLTDVAALQRELRRTRREGYGTDNGEFLDDSVCLAVPVTDRNGRMYAALAVHGPAPRMSLRKGVQYLPALRRAANAIAAAMMLAEPEGAGQTPDLPVPGARRAPRRPALARG